MSLYAVNNVVVVERMELASDPEVVFVVSQILCDDLEDFTSYMKNSVCVKDEFEFWIPFEFSELLAAALLVSE